MFNKIFHLFWEKMAVAAYTQICGELTAYELNKNHQVFFHGIWIETHHHLKNRWSFMTQSLFHNSDESKTEAGYTY